MPQRSKRRAALVDFIELAKERGELRDGSLNASVSFDPASLRFLRVLAESDQLTRERRFGFMTQDQLDQIQDTLNDLRDDLAVLIALNPKSDVVEEASKIVVNERYSDKDFQDMCRKFIGRHTRRVRLGE